MILYLRDTRNFSEKNYQNNKQFQQCVMIQNHLTQINSCKIYTINKHAGKEIMNPALKMDA